MQQITVCEHEEINGARAYVVTAGHYTDLTVNGASSDGWTRLKQVALSYGNLQGSVQYGTAAIFRNPSAGGDETLIVDSSYDCDLGAVVSSA